MFLTVVVDRDLNVALQVMLVINMQPTGLHIQWHRSVQGASAGRKNFLFRSCKDRPRELMVQEHHVNMNSDIEISKSQW